VIGAGEGWQQDKILKTRPEGMVTIRLWEDRTRGEIYMPLYDSDAVALVNDDYERSIGENWNIIDSGKHIFEFRALKPGVHRIVFEKRMGWRFTAEDRRVYVLMVSDEKASTNDDHA
jgi:predicted secreted protein